GDDPDLASIQLLGRALSAVSPHLGSKLRLPDKTELIVSQFFSPQREIRPFQDCALCWHAESPCAGLTYNNRANRPRQITVRYCGDQCHYRYCEFDRDYRDRYD